jgi:hypothetical protein
MNAALTRRSSVAASSCALKRQREQATATPDAAQAKRAAAAWSGPPAHHCRVVLTRPPDYIRHNSLTKTLALDLRATGRVPHSGWRGSKRLFP